MHHPSATGPPERRPRIWFVIATSVKGDLVEHTPDYGRTLDGL